MGSITGSFHFWCCFIAACVAVHKRSPLRCSESGKFRGPRRGCRRGSIATDGSRRVGTGWARSVWRALAPGFRMRGERRRAGSVDRPGRRVCGGVRGWRYPVSAKGWTRERMRRGSPARTWPRAAAIMTATLSPMRAGRDGSGHRRVRIASAIAAKPPPARHRTKRLTKHMPGLSLPLRARVRRPGKRIPGAKRAGGGGR